MPSRMQRALFLAAGFGLGLYRQDACATKILIDVPPGIFNIGRAVPAELWGPLAGFIELLTLFHIPTLANLILAPYSEFFSKKL